VLTLPAEAQSGTGDTLTASVEDMAAPQSRNFAVVESVVLNP